MPTHETKPEFIDAVQFDGNNGLDIQAIAGTHAVDGAGHYTVPNFDYADYWWPDRTDKDYVGVLWTGSGWVGVKVGYWLLKKADGTLNALPDDEFNSCYQAVPQ